MKKLIYDIKVETCSAINPDGSVTSAPDAVCPQTIALDFIEEVTIENSIDSLTDTAVVTLPKKLSYKVLGGDVRSVAVGSKAVFQQGRKITINAGYDYLNGKGPVMNLVFSGYIVNVIPDTQLVLECQDKMWLLKRTANTSFACNTASQLKLATLLAGGVTSTGVTVPGLLPAWASKNMKCLDLTLGGYRVNKNNSVAYELERLKDSGCFFNFRANGVFYAGGRFLKNNQTPYVPTDPAPFDVGSADVNTVNLKYEFNIISDEDMVYRYKDATTTVIGTATNHRKVTAVYQYPPGGIIGNLIRKNYNNTGMDLAALKKVVYQTYLVENYEGFTGSVMTFLHPQSQAGDAVNLVHDRVPEKNGVYLVKKVITTFGVNGGRQKIYLDRKIT